MMTERLRHWINLLSESIFIKGIDFSDIELFLTDKYGWPLEKFLKLLNNENTSAIDEKEIKEYLELFLSDGGFWGETINSHDKSTTDLKNKIIELKNSL
jgi:hypothetical protein